MNQRNALRPSEALRCVEVRQPGEIEKIREGQTWRRQPDVMNTEIWSGDSGKVL
jgi:hypothetical protein